MDKLRLRLYEALQRTERIERNDYLTIMRDAIEELLTHVQAELAGTPQPLGNKLAAESESFLQVFNDKFPGEVTLAK